MGINTAVSFTFVFLAGVNTAFSFLFWLMGNKFSCTLFLSGALVLGVLGVRIWTND